MTAPIPIECVGRRVDWLTLAFRVRLSKQVLCAFVTKDGQKPPPGARFAERAELAKKHRIAACGLDVEGHNEKVDFAMRMIGDGKIILQNGSCRVVIHECAPRSPDDPPEEPGWTVAVEWSGTSLNDAGGYAAAASESWAIARALGEILECRVRRLDLCADMRHFPIPASEDHGWCTRPQLRSRKMRAARRCPIPRKVRAASAKVGRALLTRFEAGEIDWDKVVEHFPDIDDTYYYPEGNTTGWKFGHGTISARVYDKMAEMRMRIEREGSPAGRRQAGEKKASEEAFWRASGWDGKGKIVRVEVQCRGDVLHELDARCDTRAVKGPVDAGLFVDELGRQLDRVWRYFAGSPDELLARRELPPVDAEGKCERCHVVHGSPEACKHTRAPRSGWLRQIELEQGRPRSECSATAAWKAVQSVTFERVVTEVPRRTRKRGAVRATQVLGCALALLGYAERLPHPRAPGGLTVIDGNPNRHNPQTGEVYDGSEHHHAALFAAQRPDETELEAKERVRAQVQAEVRGLFLKAADEVAETLSWIHEEDPHVALELVYTRVNAAKARWKPGLVRARPPPTPPAPDATFDAAVAASANDVG